MLAVVINRAGAKRTAAVAGVAVATVSLVGLFAAPSASAATPDLQPEVQVVVQLTAGVAPHAPRILDNLPGSLPRPLVANRWRLQVPEGEVAATIAHLRAQPGVVYASAARTVHATASPAAPDDPCYVTTCGGNLFFPPVVIDPDNSMDPTGNGGPPYGAAAPTTQSDLAQVGAARAWSYTHGSPSVTVAVLDTGVDAEQQDLTQNVTAGPVLCADDDPACVGVNGGDASDTDDNGHGTHVTGTVVGRDQQRHGRGQPRVVPPGPRPSRCSTAAGSGSTPTWRRASTTPWPPARR